MADHQDTMQQPHCSADVVPDHELIRMIGRGSAGEVWLARSALGTYRAVKIVYENSFRHKRPFEREFNGVKKFEPISRLHHGLMDILQVGYNEDSRYFYCIMELADDVVSGQVIDPRTYTPRTLTHDIAKYGRLAVDECQNMGVAIASALEFLHQRGLIHRDVKPSNIVFVDGVPKLADIGLVIEMSEAKSYVGTEGFIPPEGPGTVTADIFSLGKVLYESSTGKDRFDYPEFPTELGETIGDVAFLRLNSVIVKACRADPGHRYASAGEMKNELVALQRGERILPRKAFVPSLARTAIIIGILSIAGGLFAFFTARKPGGRATFRPGFLPPVIANVSPAFGTPGDTIILHGTNFAMRSLIVHFGAVRAQLLSASSTNLVVIQPAGATYAPITVGTEGLVGYANAPFLPTFEGKGHHIDSNSFAARIDLPTKNGPCRVVASDFDGDGQPDFAVANAYDHIITVFRNRAGDALSSGSFVSSLEIPFGQGRDNPLWVTAGDVDGDGKIDLVAADRNNARVGILKNTSRVGRLSFGSPVYFPIGIDARNAAVRDLDGDGRPELIVANCFNDSISILQNVGRPERLTSDSFAAKIDLPTGMNPQDVAAGDLDGDGKPDLVVANVSDSSITIYRNVSAPGTIDAHSFASRINLEAPYAGDSIVMGDIDGDGKVDLVLGTRSETLSVFRNVSNGPLASNSFAPPEILSAGGKVHNLALGDLNGDRKPDIVVVTELPSHMSVYENLSVPGTLSSHSFGPRIDFPSGWNASGLAIIDLDNDGRSDVVFGNAYSNTVSLCKNLFR